MVLVFLLFSLTGGLMSLPTQPVGLINSGWTDDYDEAVEAARVAGLPLLIVLEDGEAASTPFIAPRSPEAVKSLVRYRICRLDVRSEMGRRIAAGYNATQFPYTLITDARCEQIVYRGAGNFSQDSWESTLARYAGPDWRSPPATTSNGTPEASGQFLAAVNDGESMNVEDGKDVLDPGEGAFVHSDVTAAEQTAARSQRPLLAYVTMGGCHFCEQMRQMTLEDEEVQAVVARSFESVKVHREQDGAWIDQYDVRIYPTTLLIGHGGRVIDRMEGFVPPDEFLGRLQQSQTSTISLVW